MNGLASGMTFVETVGGASREPVPILSGRIMVEDGSEYACAVRISDLNALAVVTKAPGRQHDTAVCYLDGVGALSGRVGAMDLDGFILRPTLSEEQRERITVRLAWHARRASWTAEQRAALRIVPDHRDVLVRLSDERVLRGLILDLSKTGAKIQFSTTIPAVVVGEAVTAGKRYASVIRVEDEAVAIRFRLPFSDVTFNSSIFL